jgi:hypothetical protein
MQNLVGVCAVFRVTDSIRAKPDDANTQRRNGGVPHDPKTSAKKEFV